MQRQEKPSVNISRKDNDKSKSAADSNIWIYFSSPARLTLPVADEAAPGKHSCMFLKRQKAQQHGGTWAQSGINIKNQKDPPHCA